MRLPWTPQHTPRIRDHREVLLILAGLSLASQLSAQVWRRGSEFQVNSFTAGYQYEPRVSHGLDEGFIVVWYDEEGAGSGTPALVGRSFDPSGVPAGPEVGVSESSPDYPADLAASLTGTFVVVWGNAVPGPGGGSPSDIDARRLAADGTPSGPQFQVNTTSGGEYTFGPKVSTAADGGFVVAWTHYGQILGQRFDPDGSPSGGEFALTVPPMYATYASLTRDTTDGLIAVWESHGGGIGWGVVGRRFTSDGIPLGDPFVVNSYTSGNMLSPAVASTDDGGFAVAWASLGSPGNDSSEYSIQARIFDAAGAPVGDQFQVNSSTTGSQFEPDLLVDPEGGFVVTWTSEASNGTDGSSTSIQARRFAVDAIPLGGEFQVNTTTTGRQSGVGLSINALGELVVAWHSESSSGSDTSEFSIQAQRLQIPDFFDGFETGDTSRWSEVMP